MAYLTAFAAFFVIVATVLPYYRGFAWWIRMFDFPRGQIAVLGLLAGVGMVVFNRPFHTLETVLLALLILSVAYQLRRIYPYTPLGAKQVLDSDTPDDERTVRLLVSNVYMYNRSSQPLLDHVAEWEPDLVLTVETDSWWEGELSPLEKRFPYHVKQPQEDTYGMLLYSRLPLVEPTIRFIVDDSVPSIRTGVALRSGDTIAFYGLHPKPPRPDIQQGSGERDAELLLIGRSLREETHPTIVAGDLNDVAWSHTTRLFQKTSEMLDPRRGRGMYNTFHADHAWLRYPLDHIFISSHFRLTRLKRLGHVGSDHFPILVELSYEPEQHHVQTAPETSASEEEQATEKIEGGLDDAASDGNRA